MCGLLLSIQPVATASVSSFLRNNDAVRYPRSELHFSNRTYLDHTPIAAENNLGNSAVFGMLSGELDSMCKECLTHGRTTWHRESRKYASRQSNLAWRLLSSENKQARTKHGQSNRPCLLERITTTDRTPYR